MIRIGGSNVHCMLIDVKNVSSTGILQQLVRWDQEAIANGTCRHRLDILRCSNNFGSKSSLFGEMGINDYCITRLDGKR